MKIFISWSGDLSRQVAAVLRDWLASVLQNCEPWMSGKDIEAGSLWFGDISQSVRDTKFGILCVTRENMRAPWLLWEAGAIYRGLEEQQRVVPLLIDLTKSDLEPPLSLFQAKEISVPDDIFTMLVAINARLPKPIDEKKLKTQLDKYQRDLVEPCEQIMKKQAARPRASVRDQKAMIEEILQHVRAIRSRQSPSSLEFVRRIRRPVRTVRTSAPAAENQTPTVLPEAAKDGGSAVDSMLEAEKELLGFDDPVVDK